MICYENIILIAKVNLKIQCQSQVYVIAMMCTYLAKEL